ncbi:MAG: tetratricopeptide repeat protein [Acidobacteriota bacterium]|nr:tetratricopeptide repeat protein [Acidobacteriota bacterium]
MKRMNLQWLIFLLLAICQPSVLAQVGKLTQDPDLPCSITIRVSRITGQVSTKALEAFQQAIRFKLDWAEAHSNLGAAYNDSGLYLEAVKPLKQAVRLKRSLAETHRNLGKTNGKECKNLDFSLGACNFRKGQILTFLPVV